jgi:UDP-N-acetylmuramoyl-L-alanyl-D-glutamate--2,6-diaminopimelate ligase
MKLRDLLKDVKIIDLNISLDEEITDISGDSRNIKENSAFICLEGTKFDGHLYISDAMKLGAKVAITQKEMKFENNEKYVRIESGRKPIAKMACNFFENPSYKFKLIGVTGTKGKTTTTYMIKSILEQKGLKVGLIGTIEARIGDTQLMTSSNTTPDAIGLQRLFHTMANEKVDAVVMEVSSHALDLDRVYGSDFDIGIFTNLSQDHMDYHKNFENYYQAKKILFSMCKKAIVNVDDTYGKRLFDEITCDKKSFAIDNPADIKVTDFEITAKNVTFHENNIKFVVKIPGKFSVYNALAGLSVGYEFNCTNEEIQKGFDNLVVPGRSEIVNIGTDYTVMVDYAHSPDSLKNILLATKEYVKGRLICVFGCGGDRDRTKRPIMGEISAKLADISIVTSDNPRTEDPEAIITEIEGGLKNVGKEYFRIPDRSEAIYKALSIAKKDDVIVIAGKGHEPYQILKDRTIHFDDREQVQIQYERLKESK